MKALLLAISLARAAAFAPVAQLASALAVQPAGPSKLWMWPRRARSLGVRVRMRAEEETPTANGPQLEVWQAALALNAATLIWGSQHAIMKDVVEEATPSATNAARFAIAALAVVPSLPGAPWRGEANGNARVAWGAGIELGLWSFLGFALQAVGLQYTTASRSAFLLYLNVKLVPLLALLLYGRQSPVRTWVSAVLAFGGTALLSYDGGPPNIGDLWSAAAALASACFILRLEEAAQQSQASPQDINAATIVTSAALTSVWALGSLYLPPGGGDARVAATVTALAGNFPALLYLALVPTAAAQWLQALGQSRVGAQEAAVIYALDPVYAAGFSYLLLGETLGPRGLTGAAVVLFTVLINRLPISGKGDGVDAVDADANGAASALEEMQVVPSPRPAANTPVPGQE